jgi:hypothetical protein
MVEGRKSSWKSMRVEGTLIVELSALPRTWGNFTQAFDLG